MPSDILAIFGGAISGIVAGVISGVITVATIRNDVIWIKQLVFQHNDRILTLEKREK